MRARETIKVFGGSVAIYVIMAACSASSGPQANSGGDAGLARGGSSGGTPSDGSSGGSGSESSDGSGTDGSEHDDGPSILDALTDPVSEASADANQSGSRLKATFYAGADGSKQAAGMHDSQLNVDCSFQMATDGTLRCLPANGQASIYYFSDSGCTQPVPYQVKNCGTPAYALGSPAAGAPGSCSYQPATRVFPISGPYTGSSLYYASAGGCSQQPAGASGVSTIYNL